MTQIGFIGTGHIAAPMVRFLAARGNEVIVSERNAQVAAQLAASHGVRVGTNAQVVAESDVVFLCVRPHMARDVLAPLAFSADQTVVSVMAGVPLARLLSLCAPASEISMTIPLGYLEQGGCPLPVYPKADALARLFAPENPVFEVSSEEALNMHFAVCAFVPGALDLMATAGAWLAEQTGDAEQSARYVTQLLGGFLAALPDTGARTLPQARDALATEGTLSLQMTEGLRTGGAHDAVRDTLEAIGRRLEAKS
jgi:pyrroline-5-carboxylate reductase